jgi:uncharacterized protein (TIGR01319 family)
MTPQKKIKQKNLNVVLVTDCGSTTTKALLFEKKVTGWECTFRGEAPTTVENPIADVTIGVLNAFREIEELSGRKILASDIADQKPPYLALDPKQSMTGIDLYISTSSAGGGLQMVVMGLFSTLSTKSAEKAALGAGAIVMDTISFDSKLEEHEQINRLRYLKPDIILLAGGTDGGAETQVLELAEIIKVANPRPRFGKTLTLPLIFAGNNELKEKISDLLSKETQCKVVDNVRPKLEQEVIEPAREEIHEIFLSHVMSHSPGYDKLIQWSPEPIIPTPSAVGDMIKLFSARFSKQVICVDIGGATTDIFSTFKNNEGEHCFNRTVSANYGMSYSVANVMLEAGIANIKRWLPYKITAGEVRDRLRNKMIRPTSIPQTVEDLWLEQAVCREALRLSLEHHRNFARAQKINIRRKRIGSLFSQKSSSYELVNLFNLDTVIGSGGVISHAPNRLQSALMMIDGFGLQGITQLAVDSIFMLPHLGVFSKINQEAALEILFKDCLINLGYVVAPIYPVNLRQDDLLEIKINGNTVACLKKNELKVISYEEQDTLEILPYSNKISCFNFKASKTITLEKGLIGLILDGRNRPMTFPTDEAERIENQKFTYQSLNFL